MILADEVCGWEQKLKEHRVGVLNELVAKGRMSQEMHAEVEKRGRADLWERLEDRRSVMATAMDAAGLGLQQRVTDAGKKGTKVEKCMDKTRLQHWGRLGVSLQKH